MLLVAGLLTTAVCRHGAAEPEKNCMRMRIWVGQRVDAWERGCLGPHKSTAAGASRVWTRCPTRTRSASRSSPPPSSALRP